MSKKGRCGFFFTSGILNTARIDDEQRKSRNVVLDFPYFPRESRPHFFDLLKNPKSTSIISFASHDTTELFFRLLVQNRDETGHDPIATIKIQRTNHDGLKKN